MKNKYINWDENEFEKYQKEIFDIEENKNSILSLIDFKKIKTLSNEGLLKNVPFAIKDNFAITSTVTTSGSKILSDFRPNYSSTVYSKLLSAGAVPLFKTNLDELAMGGTGLTSSYNKVFNPFNKNKIIGGSSSGSAYVVAKDFVPFALGSDTGDSVRKPAAYANIVGFKPTWGIVSRYGLFDFAPTWDTVGWFTKTVDYAAKLLDILQGYDPKDSSSVYPVESDFLDDIDTNEKFKIGIIKPFLKDVVDKEIVVEYEKLIENLKKKGNEIVELDVNLDIFKTILVVYKIISSVEALSCNSNLTGFLFGSNFGEQGTYEDRIIHSRSLGFDYEVKKRFLFAAEAVLNNDEIYAKARKVRTLIIKELDRVFSLVDALVMPAHPTFAPDANPKKSLLKYGTFMDDYLTLFNANGSPSITVPIKDNKEKSIAVNIATKPFSDKKCLQIAKIVEGYRE